jgi:divinyl protochlorophyllide a 8-vinyl-reductase
MTQVAVFEIADNPLVRGEVSQAPLCDWHAAVFRRLYSVLVDPRIEVRETACCACGDAACRFEVRRR